MIQLSCFSKSPSSELTKREKKKDTMKNTRHNKKHSLVSIIDSPCLLIALSALVYVYQGSHAL